MKWQFRRVQLSDSNLILNWRNDPKVYKFLFSPTMVSKENHEVWLRNTLENNLVLFLMATYNNTEAGTVRFDFNTDFSQAEVGIYLSPLLHGKGLSVEMLNHSEIEAKRSFPSLKRITAKVILENTASEKMFIKSGYNSKYILFEKNLEQPSVD